MKNHIENYFIQSTTLVFSTNGSLFDPKEHQNQKLQWKEKREKR